MNYAEIPAWLSAARYHLQCKTRMGVTASCERGCPCERCEEAYAAAVDWPRNSKRRESLLQQIVSLYPEVEYDLG